MRRRGSAESLLVCVVCAGVIAVAGTAGAPPERTAKPSGRDIVWICPDAPPGSNAVIPKTSCFPEIRNAKKPNWRKLAAKRLKGWRAADRRAWRHAQRARGFKRTLLARPNVSEAINLACTAYGHCATLWRKARCETGGTFSPNSKNRSSSASGLFQFLDSTWASTPFARFSVFSAYANALGAGWMHANGRSGEWVCR